jgi:hypothetical protein
MVTTKGTKCYLHITARTGHGWFQEGGYMSDKIGLAYVLRSVCKILHLVALSSRCSPSHVILLLGGPLHGIFWPNRSIVNIPLLCP